METGNETGPEPPVSAPERIHVSLRNFSDKAAAERFGGVIAGCVREISRYVDLERLDGITVAYDYDDALAQLDRGFTPSRQRTRTNDERLIGVAMAVPVMRSGIVKSHPVFFAPSVIPLENKDDDAFRQALYLVAHECGHVEDLKHRDTCFPGTLLQKTFTDYEEALLEQVVGAIWEEYAACRVSALFHAEQLQVYEESFVSVVAGARERSNVLIQAYRIHGDIDRVLQEAGHELLEPLRMAAYLAGHMDGIDVSEKDVPAAMACLASSPYAGCVPDLQEALREIWSKRGQWRHRRFLLL